MNWQKIVIHLIVLVSLGVISQQQRSRLSRSRSFLQLRAASANSTDGRETLPQCQDKVKRLENLISTKEEEGKQQLKKLEDAHRLELTRIQKRKSTTVLIPTAIRDEIKRLRDENNQNKRLAASEPRIIEDNIKRYVVTELFIGTIFTEYDKEVKPEADFRLKAIFKPRRFIRPNNTQETIDVINNWHIALQYGPQNLQAAYDKNQSGGKDEKRTLSIEANEEAWIWNIKVPKEFDESVSDLIVFIEYLDGKSTEKQDILRESIKFKKKNVSSELVALFKDYSAHIATVLGIVIAILMIRNNVISNRKAALDVKNSELSIKLSELGLKLKEIELGENRQIASSPPAKFTVLEHSVSSGLCLEIKPGSHETNQFVIAVDYSEKMSGNVIDCFYGPADLKLSNQTTSKCIGSMATFSDRTQIWIWSIDKEANPAYSYYLVCHKRLKRFWSGNRHHLTLMSLE